MELAARMDALGRAERGALRSLAGPAPAEGAAERALREHVRASAPRGRGTLSRSPRFERWAVPLIAVAAGWVLAFTLWSLRDEPERADPRLGAELELLAPVGAVQDFGEFRWTAAGPEAGWYRIVVQPLDAAGRASGAPGESERVLETSWRPSAEERERWGERIRWTLEVYRATGAADLVDSKSASAELSSR
jgi:hypothetical protein